MYQWNDVSWTQLGSDIFGSYSGEHSGGIEESSAVSLNHSGHIVAIGSYNNDEIGKA
mgnify:FL=1